MYQFLYRCDKFKENLVETLYLPMIVSNLQIFAIKKLKSFLRLPAFSKGTQFFLSVDFIPPYQNTQSNLPQNLSSTRQKKREKDFYFIVKAHKDSNTNSALTNTFNVNNQNIQKLRLETRMSSRSFNRYTIPGFLLWCGNKNIREKSVNDVTVSAFSMPRKCNVNKKLSKDHTRGTIHYEIWIIRFVVWSFLTKNLLVLCPKNWKYSPNEMGPLQAPL